MTWILEMEFLHCEQNRGHQKMSRRDKISYSTLFYTENRVLGSDLIVDFQNLKEGQQVSWGGGGRFSLSRPYRSRQNLRL